MKFRVERDALADAVAWTAKSLPSRPSVPVLAGVLLRVADGRLHVSGFDYEVSSQVTVEVQADADGATLVSGRLLAEITKALPAKPVDVAAVGATWSWSAAAPGSPCRRCRSRTTRRCRRCRPAPARVDAADVRRGRRPGRHRGRPRRHAADADRRPDRDRGRQAHPARHRPLPARHARARLAARTTRTISLHALVPARTLADTAKTLGPLGGEVTVALAQGGAGEGMIGFAGGTRRTTTRLLDGEFPKVASLLPDQPQRRGPGPGRGAVEAVKRVALVAERTTPVRLRFSDDGLVVEAGGSEDAQASEAMEATSPASR